MMLRWFKAWRERRKLRKFALGILSDPAPSIDALIKAKGIMAALADRKAVCKHCFEPFTPKDRSFPERFQMRSILMLPDSEPDPMLCDSCFNTVSSVYNPQTTNIGTSNSGPANLVLQKLN
jgi:hypothetical protein